MDIVYGNKSVSEDNLKEKLRRLHFHFHQQNFCAMNNAFMGCDAGL
jgi:hypothetical protein